MTNGTIDNNKGLVALVKVAAARGIGNRAEEERMIAASDLHNIFDPVQRDVTMACF